MTVDNADDRDRRRLAELEQTTRELLHAVRVLEHRVSDLEIAHAEPLGSLQKAS